MNYQLHEKELKKRLNFPYRWGRKQTNDYDKLTKFIYHTFLFEELLQKIEIDFKERNDYLSLKNYALNRWFNFWSAKAVENIFCESPKAQAHQDSYHKFTDFYIDGIPFDHKTSVYPKGFNKSFLYAKDHEQELIKWLYQNQSVQQRKHYKNRLFIVLVNTENTAENWKLKSDILWLKEIISTYLINFDRRKLYCFSMDNNEINADIIWAIK